MFFVDTYLFLNRHKKTQTRQIIILYYHLCMMQCPRAFYAKTKYRNHSQLQYLVSTKNQKSVQNHLMSIPAISQSQLPSIFFKEEFLINGQNKIKTIYNIVVELNQRSAPKHCKVTTNEILAKCVSKWPSDFGEED